MPLELSDTARRADARSPEYPVAQTLQREIISWAHLQARVDFWSEKVTRSSSTRVAVYHNDSVEFLAILLSVWRNSKIAVVPQNQLEATLAAVSQYTNSFVGEFYALLPEQSNSQTSEHDFAADTALILFTSGSEGAPTAIRKSFAQLNAEIEMLEETWGVTCADSLHLGTVTHHHMYGLPFRLLWPFACGRMFLAQELVYLEQLQKVGNARLTLISSPAHLERLPVTLDWARFHDRLCAVFSAGAPLHQDTAVRASQILGIKVTEIYGGTETGAVATRCPSDNQWWRTLGAVKIACREGKLAIQSPTIENADWFQSEDLCELNDAGEFLLHGRADQILKVGGKRISATAMERRLAEHAFVGNARVVLLQHKISRVGAVIQLSEKGKAALVDRGRQALGKDFVEHLRGHVEQVAWPRYWRFVPELPRNSQGKTTSTALQALFEEAARPLLPNVFSRQEEGENSASLEFSVPPDLFYLQGHFPGTPILPGVIQVSWAVHFGQEIFGDLGKFSRLEVLKFQQVIQPNEQILLQLEWDKQRRKLSFSYAANKTNSSGRIQFA